MKRKGFTLVELLVVISIIALLMAILMPVLSKVKAIANQMVCGTNLSGIGKSMMLYAGENDGDYPIAGGRNPEWTSTGKLGTSDTDWYEDKPDDAYGEPPGALVTVTSSLYLLVKYADMTPAQFVCSGDVGTGEFKLANYPAIPPALNIELDDCWDFGPTPGTSCSYSYHMPYIAGQSPDDRAFPISQAGDPASPIAGDRNLYADNNASSYRPTSLSGGTEEAPRFVNNRYTDLDKTGNSACHQRNGQNVLFNDTHVDFERFPNVGINNDNIYKFWDSATLRDAEESQVLGRPTGTRGIIKGAAAPQDYRDALLVHEF